MWKGGVTRIGAISSVINNSELTKNQSGKNNNVNFKSAYADIYKWAEKENLPKVLNGYGIAIISTSKGIMTDKEARKQNIGGEVMAYIW